MIIIYASKPVVTKYFINLFKKEQLFKDKKIVFLHSLYFINIKHKFPNNISWNEVPKAFEQQFKLTSFNNWHPLIYDNYILTEEELDFSILNEAEQILFCGDPCAFETFQFSLFVEHFNLPINKIKTPNKILSLDEDLLKKYFSSYHCFYELFQKEILMGKIKNYFDYQFNIHSLIIFGELLKRMNKDNQKHFVSKYMIQLLYHMKDLIANTERQLLIDMIEWKGTGKYKEKMTLGSETSVAQIIQNLLSLNFIMEITNKKFKKIVITEEGKNFLNMIHKDCQDSDLPFRLSYWCLLDFDNAKQKIDYYIYHYFRKIKNNLKYVV